MKSGDIIWFPVVVVSKNKSPGLNKLAPFSKNSSTTVLYRTVLRSFSTTCPSRYLYWDWYRQLFFT
eukprot:SAG22_NODE_220_length_14862_cov_73.769424_2_plen_66_part_00